MKRRDRCNKLLSRSVRRKCTRNKLSGIYRKIIRPLENTWRLHATVTSLRHRRLHVIRSSPGPSPPSRVPCRDSFEPARRFLLSPLNNRTIFVRDLPSAVYYGNVRPSCAHRLPSNRAAICRVFVRFYVNSFLFDRP